ncbi:MAG TPA: hypothetical protein VMW56_26595 [Candidatus Margulisiibacteriota bacterium]|nr:hypothetical protein [Candidatus Margulisiibacteriota bacterium]
MSSIHKAGAPGGAPPGESRAPAQTHVFRCEGDYWSIVYAGVAVHVRDGIGMRYLAHLLARPQQRIRVDELLAIVKGTTVIDVKRARSAVSKRIRGAVERIGQHHGGLGYHLKNAIRTGRACAYEPDPQQLVRWRL